jgi:hypothetical protein
MSENKKKYMSIVSHYESCFERHGDCHLGVDWPNAADACTRYRVMLDVIREAPVEPVSLLDFGCGASHLYEYLRAEGIGNVRYSGLDLSAEFVRVSRKKYPENDYYMLDVLEQPDALPCFDYIVMNGVLTEKLDLTFDEMFTYSSQVLTAIFSKARRGIAFNLMSKQVDWERDDLFHLSMDQLASFLSNNLSRHFVFRSDYGLYEYTVYVYHEASRGKSNA